MADREFDPELIAKGEQVTLYYQNLADVIQPSLEEAAEGLIIRDIIARSQNVTLAEAVE